MLQQNDSFVYLNQVKTHQFLSIKIGDQMTCKGMNLVSDSPLRDHEIDEYMQYMKQRGFPLLHKDEVAIMKETQINPWLDHLRYEGITVSDETIASLSLYKAMTIPPNRLLEWCNEPFFEKAFLHFYVQVLGGSESASQNHACRYCRIQAVEENLKEYYEVEVLHPVRSTVCE